MDERSEYLEQFRSAGFWNPETNLCPCNGRGWLLSELDTWHRCPHHGANKRHPEDELETTLDLDPTTL